MAFKAFDNIIQWGGTFLGPASSDGQDATVISPTMRNIPRKGTYVFPINFLAISGKFTSQWIDTNQTGGTLVNVNVTQTLAAWNAVANALTIQGTNDIAATSSYVNLYISGTDNLQSGYNALFPVSTRYWRIVLQNDASTTKTNLSVTANEVINPFLVTAQQSRAGFLQAAVFQGQQNIGGYADGSNTLAYANGSAANGNTNGVVPVIVSAAVTGTPVSNANTNSVALRTPSIFRGGQLYAAAGAVPIWTPTTGKKVRLMKYKIEVGEDCTITSGPLPVNIGLRFGAGTSSLITQNYTNIPSYTHRCVLPATVLATSFEGFDSGWIDLGNGVISGAINQPLFVGLMTPQSTGAVNPTWTIPSNQWEAISIGFKTQNASGNFKLASQVTTGGGTTTSTWITPTTLGNTVIIVAKTINSVTGIPVFSVSSNTAGDTYTVTAVTTNATDGANGSSICILYVTNSKGSASNTITVSATNSPTSIITHALEYSGMGTGGIDAAAVGATGNSTSPAAGNYTPATAGDLIVTAFGSSTSIGAAPTALSAAFFPIAGTFGGGGSFYVADNFGTAVMAAGGINAVAIGTEE